MVVERYSDNFGPDDCLKPEIRLIQFTGGEKAKEAGAKPGQFFNVATGEVYPDGFEMVVLDIIKTRTYWGRDTLGDEPPVCASLDAKSYESINGDNCQNCEHRCDNAAMVDAKTRRSKCTISYTIMGMMPDSLAPFMLRCTGISATPVMSLITQMVYNKEAHNKENPRSIDWHRFKIVVSASKRKTPSGEAFAFHFGNVTPFGDANHEKQMLDMTMLYLGSGSLALPAGKTEEISESQTITSADVDDAAQVIAPKTAPPAPAPARSAAAKPRVRVVEDPPAPPPAAPPKTNPAPGNSTGIDFDI